MLSCIKELLVDAAPFFSSNFFPSIYGHSKTPGIHTIIDLYLPKPTDSHYFTDISYVTIGERRKEKR